MNLTRPAHVTLAGLAIVSAVARGPTPQPPPPQQSFRSTTDVVMVDVSVRKGGSPVAGLTAGDFVLQDNGVKQRIDSVEASAVPIDVTLVVDLSGDPRGPWIDRPTPSAIAGPIDAEVQQVTRMLRADDRIRLLVIDTYSRQVFPLKAAASVAPVQQVASGGMAALYDTLVAALLQPVEPSRRHVVIARTKGRDTISSVDARAVRDVARYSDALLHVVMMETAADNEDELRAFQCDPVRGMGLCSPTRKFWVPFQRRSMTSAPIHTLLPAGLLLAEAAQSTGGALHQAAVITEPTLAGTFRQAFDDFRRSYILRYTPQGVKRDGWHAITVTVPGSPSATVHARKGYAIESPPPAPPVSAATPARSPSPRTLEEMIAAYGRGEYLPVAAALEQALDPTKLIRDFTEAGNPWPSAPRREAVLALELAEAGVFSHRGSAQDEAQKLLDRFTRLVRHPLEPDAFERYWLWAELTILEGAIRPAVTQAFLRRALERFPEEPRFLLARAIVTDQLFPFSGSVRTAARTPAGQATTTHITNVTEQYEAAMTFAETGAEARVRLGWFLHRIGRNEDAIARLDEAGDAGLDSSVRYIRQLFRGHVLTALGRDDAAIDAYRAALVVWPRAQSAGVALMNALLHRGDRTEAEQLAEAIQIAPGDADPWWSYWQGDYRHYSSAIARLRQLIQ